MVFTLHRYIFKELIKVFVMTTLALTMALSLGSMLREIQGYGVGPKQVIQLLGYFIPIVLTVVLPMAAVFASALVYGRFASDNELDACRASGVSMTTLVYPGFTLAIAVSIATLMLSFHIVPSFVHKAEMSIKANVKQILFRNIQRNGYYDIPGQGYTVYADKASLENNELQGVVALKRDASGFTELIPAESIIINIEQKENVNMVSTVTTNAYQLDEFRQSQINRLPFSTEVESLLTDNVKFQKIEQLKAIKADMLNFKPVKKIAMNAKAQLITEMIALDINKTFTEKTKEYYILSDEDMIVYFTVAGCTAKKNQEIELTGPIKLWEVDKIQQKLICEYECDSGNIEVTQENETVRIVINMDNPEWDRGGGINGIALQHVVRAMPLPESIENAVNKRGILSTLSDLSPVLEATPTPALLGQIAKLNKEIWRTSKGIVSEIHWRLVMGLGNTTLVLISIAIGIRLKGGHLLSAFGASSIPAGILVIFIMTGKNMIRTTEANVPEIAGIIVMWSGLIILSVFALFMYRKLMKT